MENKKIDIYELIKVSIIIPIYNVSRYIGECLRSVYEQTYSCLEVILVNDATPDDSMEQAALWMDKLREKCEVKIVNHAINKGLSAARNTGIKAATADWIYFLDSDDEITPDCIRLMVEQVRLHPNLDFVIGSVKVVGSKWRYPLTCQPYVDSNEEILQDYVNSKWYVMAWNHLYRKEYLLQHNLFFKDGIYHEDLLFSFQVAITAQSMASVNVATYIYKVRSSGSITSQGRLKNFEDMLEINSIKFDYILHCYQKKDFTIPFTYCIDLTYWFECSVAENINLSLASKVDLINRMIGKYRLMKQYYRGGINLKYKIMYILQEFPALFICKLIELRLLLQK